VEALPSSIKLPMPKARFRVEPQRAGASSPATSPLIIDCRNIWHDAASPRWSGKGSSACKVRQGMDNDMPKVSGVELLHKLHAAHIALPVIMATGRLPAEEFTQCPWIQPAALLIKPYSFHELLETVRRVLPFSL